METRDRFGVTSIVISHDMASALKTADRIYLLSAGRIVYNAPTLEFSRSEHPEVRAFLESSGVVSDALHTPASAIDYRPR